MGDAFSVSFILSWCAPNAGFGAVSQFSFRYWSPWEKFPGEHHVKLWDGTKLSRFAESPSSIIVLYSRFIWLNGSVTLIGAETERYDIVGFSKVTTKSLASGTGSYESIELGESKIAGELWPGPRCENKANVIRRPCDSTSGNLNKTSVREC